MTKLIDIHLHLQDKAFSDDVDVVIERALKNGVKRFVCNGTREKDWLKVQKLAEQYPFIVPCYGIHPWYVKKLSENWLEKLEELLIENKNACIGEIGLDKCIKDKNETAQKDVFRKQLDLAKRLKRPVMIHCVQAWGWLMDILRNESPLPMLLHSYSGSAEMIKPLLDMGAYFSFSGYALNKNNKKMQESLKKVPLDRLFIETDSPSMLHSKRNEPANLLLILQGVAELRGETEEELALAIWENSERFLNV